MRLFITLFLVIGNYRKIIGDYRYRKLSQSEFIEVIAIANISDTDYRYRGLSESEFWGVIAIAKSPIPITIAIPGCDPSIYVAVS